MSYFVGQTMRFQCLTYNSAGALADATSLSLVVTTPGKFPTSTTVEIGDLSHPSTGTYTHTMASTVSGRWSYSWRGAVAGTTVIDKGTVDVLP